jgi:hypothetical protein
MDERELTRKIRGLFRGWLSITAIAHVSAN